MGVAGNYTDDASEWLIGSWPQPQQVYFSQTSGMPLPYKMAAPPPYHLAAPQATPPFVMLHPSEGSSPGTRASRRSRSQSGRGLLDTSSGSERRGRSKSPRHSSVDGVARKQAHQQQVLVPAGHYAPLELYYPYVAPPVASYPSPAPGPASHWGYPGPWIEYDYYNPQYYDYGQYMMYAQHQQAAAASQRGQMRAPKRARSKSGAGSPDKYMHHHHVHPGPVSSRAMKSNMKQKSSAASKKMTDSDIERTYTGLDRELAEEFIKQTMADPSGGGHPNHSSELGGDHHRNNVQSGTESEAW